MVCLVLAVTRVNSKLLADRVSMMQTCIPQAILIIYGEKFISSKLFSEFKKSKSKNEDTTPAEPVAVNQSDEPVTSEVNNINQSDESVKSHVSDRFPRNHLLLDTAQMMHDGYPLPMSLSNNGM